MQYMFVVSQAVLQREGDTAAVRLPRGTGEHPGSAESFHLGSQDLIRLAGFAQENGFQVSQFFVADPYLSPLDSEEERFISERMIQLLNTYGARELRSAMEDEFDGFYVVGVALISKRSGMRITVRRRGFVDTSIVEEAESLLTSAWKERSLR
ncbi:hypothetical protein [Curtobacterium caseinilyticum]|uniref:Uncharacterized protein n=1 Tax=Curtobacterium caseinilyticum TaxID=3055137 RepID=A0ABT7TMC6_9MICO|nr:hypothetical protein [Curtobacterium caseinilyticum]MDM7890685.1 hypothetical protein [Curtobacterium caseinilyticum]